MPNDLIYQSLIHILDTLTTLNKLLQAQNRLLSSLLTHLQAKDDTPPWL